MGRDCKPFPFAQRSSNILDLVYSDICEMNEQLTMSVARYFITLIDDYFRFYYVYLLSSKDEALVMFKTYKMKL